MSFCPINKGGRIEWIDTAKGICISFVILWHISEVYGIQYKGSDILNAFRMPLYFLLSGLFFKEYEGITGFTKRKLNKILIPYIFFFIVAGVILPYIIYRTTGFCLRGYSNAPGLWAVKWIFSEHTGANPPIWFLVCLFEVNILFYIIKIVGKKPLPIFLLSLGFGCVGLMISWYNLPNFYVNGKGWYFIDTAFSMTPFFYFGWFLRNKTSFLYWENTPKNVIGSFVLIVISVVLIHYVRHGWYWPFYNYYGHNKIAFVEMYSYGILGSLSVLSFSRILKRIPIISYWGRYSLIVLCTHDYVYQFWAIIVSRYMSYSYFLYTTFVLSVLSCTIIIPIIKKTLPYFTAQKDLIPIP